jgi:diguanylate cyclase (GGDEF)-like protein
LFVRAAVTGVGDDRPVPELGLGDEEGATALVAALRALLTAREPEGAVVVLARFVVALGGGLSSDAEAPDVIPLDLAFGTGGVLFPVAESLSVARMRLEQLLPRLVEDARGIVARIRNERELTEAAARDALTGVLSRRQLLRALASAQPGDAVVVIDVDGFKQVNDEHGHRQGDAVLEALGRVLLRSVRGDDMVGRYGGDEMVLLLRGMSTEAAQRRVVELRDRWDRARPSPVTLSAGVAAVDEGGWPVALQRADAAMYADKQRNAS